MNLKEFKDTLSQAHPPADTDPVLQALWHDAKGDWDTAHNLLQGQESRAASWVHAYLHRKEGDNANAAYWYSRSGQSVSTQTLEAEWDHIAQALLNEHSD